MLEPSLRKEKLSISRNDRKRSLLVCLFVCFVFLGKMVKCES